MLSSFYSILFLSQVRVPTHPEGSSLYWEFATDSYDIGFGVYFEWTLEPGDQITVQTSDSEDEGDEEGDEEPPEAGGEQAATSTGAAQPPKGSSITLATATLRNALRLERIGQYEYV